MWQRYSYKNARGHHDPGRLRFLKPVIQLITTLLRLSEQHCGQAPGFCFVGVVFRLEGLWVRYGRHSGKLRALFTYRYIMPASAAYLA